MASGSQRAVLVALLGNAIIALTKLIVALLTKSSAMLAEAFHSMADMGNQALLLLGIKRSKRLPDKNHPFGYGKEQYFWSFVVANMLFFLGAVASIYEGVNKIIHPHTIEKVSLIYIILGASFLTESLSLSVAVKEFFKKRRNKGVWKEIKESKDPNLIVILVEDSAALMGLIIAFTGVLLVDFTEIAIFDAIASIIIGIILAVVAFFLANEMRKLLIGEGANEGDLKLISLVVKEFSEVERLGEVLTMHMGPESILLAMNIDFKDEILSGELEKVIERLEKRVKEVVPEGKQVFIEADKVKVKKRAREAMREDVDWSV